MIPDTQETAWTPVTTPPLEDGWCLVTWESVGDSRRYVECSEYSKHGYFSDRWGSNSTPVAWMPLPEPSTYQPIPATKRD